MIDLTLSFETGPEPKIASAALDEDMTHAAIGFATIARRCRSTPAIAYARTSPCDCVPIVEAISVHPIGNMSCAAART